MAYTAKDPCPPWHFLYLRETKSWRCEEEEGEGGEQEHILRTGPTVYITVTTTNHLQIMRRQSVMIQSFNARQFCLIGKQLSAEF